MTPAHVTLIADALRARGVLLTSAVLSDNDAGPVLLECMREPEAAPVVPARVHDGPSIAAWAFRPLVTRWDFDGNGDPVRKRTPKGLARIVREAFDDVAAQQAAAFAAAVSLGALTPRERTQLLEHQRTG